MGFIKFKSLLITTALLGGCWSENSTTSTDALDYELLLAKMDYLEYKFIELQVEVKEQGESLAYNQERNKAILLEQTRDILEQQKIFANHEAIKRSIFELRPRKHPADNSKLLALLSEKTCVSNPEQNATVINSCKSDNSKTSGRYSLTVSNTTFEVYCESTAYEGGWIVIQNRFNGSVDFYRGWNDYKNGFGNLDGEFWLGLEKIYLLTSSKPHKLLVHLEDFNGYIKYAKYEKFAIGNDIAKYALQTLGTYSGTAGDSLKADMGADFSTTDSGSSCAVSYKGPWWHKSCHYSNLNGLYMNKKDTTSMSWHSFHSAYQGLKVSKMMIREV